MTRILGIDEKLADRAQQLVNPDRLGDIALATAAKNAVLIAAHRERGHREDRYVLELAIALDDLSNFQAGDTWELNVHDNQIRSVFARQSDGLHAVPGAQRPVTMGLKNVVKQLHIKLVVLDNEYCFRHDALSTGDQIRLSRDLRSHMGVLTVCFQASKMRIAPAQPYSATGRCRI